MPCECFIPEHYQDRPSHSVLIAQSPPFPPQKRDCGEPLRVVLGSNLIGRGLLSERSGLYFQDMMNKAEALGLRQASTGDSSDLQLIIIRNLRCASAELL